MRYCCLCCYCCCCLRVSDERQRRVEVVVKIEMGFEETRRDGAEEEACQMVLKRGEERLGATCWCGLEEDGRGPLWRGSVVIVRWYVLEPSAALSGCAPDNYESQARPTKHCLNWQRHPAILLPFALLNISPVSRIRQPSL